MKLDVKDYLMGLQKKERKCKPLCIAIVCSIVVALVAVGIVLFIRKKNECDCYDDWDCYDDDLDDVDIIGDMASDVE